MTHSRQVLRRVYRDAVLEKIPLRAEIGEVVVILDRRERRKIARRLSKEKKKEIQAAQNAEGVSK